MQEFQVNTSNYSAEYGRAAGGVINTVTKSGSNQLRGEVFFYDRDNGVGGATNPYTQLYNFDQNTGLNISDPQAQRLAQAAGDFGCRRRTSSSDKLFWFYAYDRLHRNFPGIARTSTSRMTSSRWPHPLSGRETCSALRRPVRHL